MAQFNMMLPDEVLKEFDFILDNTDQIFGEIVKTGAETVKQNIENLAPSSLKKSKIMKNLKLSKIYKTKSDDGINNKVLFAGYFKDKKNERVAAPLVVNMFEYGSNKHNYPKHPFVRPAFLMKNVESSMLKAQEKVSRGILKNE